MITKTWIHRLTDALPPGFELQLGGCASGRQLVRVLNKSTWRHRTAWVWMDTAHKLDDDGIRALVRTLTDGAPADV